MENAPAAPAAPTASAAYPQIPLNQIKPSPYQARKDFSPEDLQGLAESMKEEGLLQPIVVRQVNGSYQLVSGERRFRAAKLLNWPAIDAKVVETVSEAESAAKGLVENLQRKDLNAIEEAEGFAKLNQMDPVYWTQEKIALVAGKSQTYVSRSSGLQSLPEEVKDNMRRRIISRDHGIELLRLSDSARQVQVAKQIIDNDLGRGETRKLVDQMLDEGRVEGGKGKGEGRNSKDSVSPLAHHPSPFTFKQSGPDILGTFRFPKSSNLEDELAKLKAALLQWLPTAQNGRSKFRVSGSELPALKPETRNAKPETVLKTDAPRFPHSSADQAELESLAAGSPGPGPVYAWIFGPDHEITQFVQKMSWADLQVKDGHEGLLKILEALKQFWLKEPKV